MEYEIRIRLYRNRGPQTECLLIVHATGGRDVVAAGRGEAPVDHIDLKVENFDAPFIHNTVLPQQGPAALDYPAVAYALGALTRTQVEIVLARLVDSRLLEDGVFGPVPDGRYDAFKASIERAAAVQTWLQDATREVVALGEHAELPAGWGRFHMHTPTTWGVDPEMVLCRDEERPELAGKWWRGSDSGVLSWPEGHPEQAVFSRPEAYISAMREYQERNVGVRPPLAREIIAAAAWRAGFHNVRVLAETLGADRKTIYADLRRAGLEPTER
jgi:hypothetical protein